MDEFLSGISAAINSIIARVYTYTYKYNTYEKYIRLKRGKKAVIFKFLKCTVPSLVCSLAQETRSIVHTGSIFLSKKGKCSQRCSNVPNAESFIYISLICFIR